MTKRIGASSKAAIAPTILQQLNEGTMQSATLSECLAVDFACLMRHGFPGIKAEAIDRMHTAADLGITKRMELAAAILTEQVPKEIKGLPLHPSDTVRGWAAYCIADSSVGLEDAIDRVRPLADDPHFGVREWAWLAVRPVVAQDIEKSINLLMPWSSDRSENIRRFAIEVTRPRGVWSKHIAALKTSPGLGEGLLDRVMEDPSRYVQDSCANWLNDAAKSCPDWVVGHCAKWRKKSDSQPVGYITRRALRSLDVISKK
ncbi:MAG: DNA alkylation repair protein [Alkalinema sp. RU_4_3]|nr:DNA alkylation repair protein [Alkalinema sp. RU_4_3]